MFELTNPFHVGVIVPDAEKAMADYTAATGATWHTLQALDLSILIDGEVVQTSVRFNYTVEGPVQFEVADGPDDSPWDASMYGGLNHIGCWSDDLHGDHQRLADAGWKTLHGGAGEDGQIAGFVFVQSPAGDRVELLDTAMKPLFANWFAGGNFE
ncbi:MAG: VOC family protein [Acidimicrobiales bacterium]